MVPPTNMQRTFCQIIYHPLTLKENKMLYQEFKEAIARGEQIPDYHQHVLIHAEDILLDIGKQGQVVTAIDINLSYAKLSAIKPFLVAYTELHSAVH